MQSDHSFCACEVCYNIVKSVIGTSFILNMYLKNVIIKMQYHNKAKTYVLNILVSNNFQPC